MKSAAAAKPYAKTALRRTTVMIALAGITTLLQCNSRC